MVEVQFLIAYEFQVRAKGTLRLYDEIGEQVVCFEITVDLQ